jgi:polar amino acid transport system substrate-binding protein
MTMLGHADNQKGEYRMRLKLASLLAFMIVSNPVASSAQALWDKILDSGELVCGAVAAQSPTSWKVSGPTEYEGTAINTCRQIAEDLTVDTKKPIKVKWVEFSYATVVLDLQSGRLDIAAGMTATEERKKVLDMPGPLYAYPDAVVYRKGFEPRKLWGDYNDPTLRVASLQGAGSEKTVIDLLPDATRNSFKSPAEMYLSVQSGHSDLFVVGFAQAVLAMTENGAAFGGLQYPDPKHVSPSGLGIRRDGDGRFNTWLQAWCEKRGTDGTMKRLVRDAFGKAGVDLSLLEGSGM